MKNNLTLKDFDELTIQMISKDDGKKKIPEKTPYEIKKELYESLPILYQKAHFVKNHINLDFYGTNPKVTEFLKKVEVNNQVFNRHTQNPDILYKIKRFIDYNQKAYTCTVNEFDEEELIRDLPIIIDFLKPGGYLYLLKEKLTDKLEKEINKYFKIIEKTDILVMAKAKK